MSRTVCGGGKGPPQGSAYDPQIGRAAASAAATSAAAQQFSETFYNDVITPLLQQQSTSATENQARMGAMHDLNAEQMRMARDRYVARGIPAEERYYGMVDRYSEGEEMERQATAAKGDFAAAQANQQGALGRQMSAMGIDPTSGAAISARNDAAIMGAANETSAMNRARGGARQLGMQLTSDAANFGRGGQSGILAFGAGAQGNAQGAFGVANAALGTGMQAGNMVNQGYQTAVSGYNGIMSNYSQLGSTQIQANAQYQDPLAQMAGSAMGLAAAAYSDERLKENIVKIGELASGVGVYLYNMIGSAVVEMGVIAQEVLRAQPDAVTVGPTGYLKVNYGKLR